MVNTLLTTRRNAGERGNVGLDVFTDGARFGHAGDNTGFNCQWLSCRDEGEGCVIMTNSDEGWWIIEKLERAIARVYAWSSAR